VTNIAHHLRGNMALQPCPECAREVSSSAAACPHCGHPVVAAQAVSIPGEPIVTTQATSKDIKIHTLLSVGLGIVGLLMAMSPDPAAQTVGGVLLFVALSWYIGTRITKWWRHA